MVDQTNMQPSAQPFVQEGQDDIMDYLIPPTDPSLLLDQLYNDFIGNGRLSAFSELSQLVLNTEADLFFNSNAWLTNAAGINKACNTIEQYYLSSTGSADLEGLYIAATGVFGSIPGVKIVSAVNVGQLSFRVVNSSGQYFVCDYSNLANSNLFFGESVFPAEVHLAVPSKDVRTDGLYVIGEDLQFFQVTHPFEFKMGTGFDREGNKLKDKQGNLAFEVYLLFNGGANGYFYGPEKSNTPRTGVIPPNNSLWDVDGVKYTYSTSMGWVTDQQPQPEEWEDTYATDLEDDNDETEVVFEEAPKDPKEPNAYGEYPYPSPFPFDNEVFYYKDNFNKAWKHGDRVIAYEDNTGTDFGDTVMVYDANLQNFVTEKEFARYIKGYEKQQTPPKPNNKGVFPYPPHYVDGQVSCNLVRGRNYNHGTVVDLPLTIMGDGPTEPFVYDANVDDFISIDAWQSREGWWNRLIQAFKNDIRGW